MYISKIEDFWEYTRRNATLECLVADKDMSLKYLLVTLPMEAFVPVDSLLVLIEEQASLELPDTPDIFVTWKIRAEDVPSLFSIYFASGINTNTDLFIYPKVIWEYDSDEGSDTVGKLTYGEGGEPVHLDMFNTIRTSALPPGAYFTKKYMDFLLSEFRRELQLGGYIH